MSVVLNQIPVRLQTTIGHLAPIDANTGEAPVVFRAQSLAVPFVIFAVDGSSVDLTNLTSITLDLLANAGAETPLASKTLLASDLTKTILRQAWLDGSAQQGTFLFSAAETDVSLGGTNSASLWLRLSGITSGGIPLIYAAGPATFQNPGVRIPAAPYGYVSLNRQTNNAGNSTVAPGSLNHTEIVDVTGSARTSVLILSTTGMHDGAVLRLRVNLSNTLGIGLSIRNGDVGGTELATLATGGGLGNAILFFVYDEVDGTWELLAAVAPATL